MQKIQNSTIVGDPEETTPSKLSTKKNKEIRDRNVFYGLCISSVFSTENKK